MENSRFLLEPLTSDRQFLNHVRRVSKWATLGSACAFIQELQSAVSRQTLLSSCQSSLHYICCPAAVIYHTPLLCSRATGTRKYSRSNTSQARARQKPILAPLLDAFTCLCRSNDEMLSKNVRHWSIRLGQWRSALVLWSLCLSTLGVMPSVTRMCAHNMPFISHTVACAQSREFSWTSIPFW